MRRNKLYMGAVFTAMILSVSLSLGGMAYAVKSVSTPVTVQAEDSSEGSESQETTATTATTVAPVGDGGQGSGSGNGGTGETTTTTTAQATTAQATTAPTLSAEELASIAAEEEAASKAAEEASKKAAEEASKKAAEEASKKAAEEEASRLAEEAANSYEEETQAPAQAATEAAKTEEVAAASVSADAPVESAAVETDTTQLLSAQSTIFTDAEKAQIAAGATPHVNLVVDSVDVASIPTEDKTKIEEQVAEALQSQSAVSNIMYLDLTLTKQIGNARSASAVTDTGSDIKISVKLPDNMISTDINTNRKYTVIRLHEGVVTALDGEFDPATGELSFETNAFSTYAVAYVDVPVASAPQTGDVSAVMGWLIAMISAACVMAAAFFVRKRS